MEEVYAWGSGSYGRLGLGHSRDAATPQRVSGVLNGYDVRSGSCGWYHSAVVTSTGDIATFGSKVTRCLGAAASDSDSSQSGSESEDNRRHGGGSASEGGDSLGLSGSDGELRPFVAASSSTDAASRAGLRRRGGGGNGLGIGNRGLSSTSGLRHHRAGADEPTSRETDYVPQVLRSFPSRVTIVQVAVGGDMLGAHTLAVSKGGRLYSWGYGPACGLGSTANVGTPTLVTKFLGFGADDVDANRQQEMEPVYGRHSHARYRTRTSNRRLGLQLLKPKIVKAVCGGGFSAVLSSDGEVFTFGLSAGGRLGFRTKFRAQMRPRRIESLKEGATDLAAGAGFMLLCTAAGRLVSWGDNAKGQLGIGHLQESYEPRDLGRVCPAAFVFQAVAAGDSHSLALDSAGNTYSWGGEGGPMTGHGHMMPNPKQVDAAFQFRLRVLPHWWVRPCQVKALAGMHVVHVAAGCLHSVALTREGVLFAWGALLQAGASGPTATTPEVAWVPRLLAPTPKLPLVRITSAAAGGWHSMATAVPSCAIEMLSRGDSSSCSSGVALGSAAGIDASGVANCSVEDFCDGFLVSRTLDVAERGAGEDVSPRRGSGAGEEARVPLCCAAARARLANADGSDSLIWKAFSMQIARRPLIPPPLAWSGSREAPGFSPSVKSSASSNSSMTSAATAAARAREDRAMGGDSVGCASLSSVPQQQRMPSSRLGGASTSRSGLVDDDSDEAGESLMDIIALRRERPASQLTELRARRRGARSGRLSAQQNVESPAEADEAAGKAVRSLPPIVEKKQSVRRDLPPPQEGEPPPTPPQKSLAPRSIKAVPEFSSDSSDSTAATKRRVKQMDAATSVGTPSPVPQVLRPAQSRVRVSAPQPRPVPIFSSDSSSSDNELRPRQAQPPPRVASSLPGSARSASGMLGTRGVVQRASGVAASLPGSARGAGGGAASSSTAFSARARLGGSTTLGSGRPREPSVVPKLNVHLSDFGEPVLAAFVRFLHTDSLGNIEVIDDTHPNYSREPSHGRQRSRGNDAVDAGVHQGERLSRIRASKGQLLRKEVDDLRRIGSALGLERLAQLCDQLLLRIDAPGAPALFVPSTTLGQAMQNLLRQALGGPSRDGPDTRVLCRPPPLGQRRRRWGHNGVPKGGELWAHAFVLCTGCNGVTLPAEPDSLGSGAGGSSSSTANVGGASATQASRLSLRHCRVAATAATLRGGSAAARAAENAAAVRFELDLRDVQAEVVFAWLRYLYTQEDLSLLWPCSGDGLAIEDVDHAVNFWMELLRLAQRLGDLRTELYAQDALIGALTAENWAQMAMFAEEAKCRALSEAALMTGVRRLTPALCRSFKVPTGLEPPDAQKSEESTSTMSATGGAVATSLGGRPGTQHGQVELELERRLLSLHLKDRSAAALNNLKHNSQAQFTELKIRLAEGVKSSQQVAEQLQRCARYFDSPTRESGHSESFGGRRWWLELSAMVAVLVVLFVPVLRQGVIDLFRFAAEWAPAAEDLPWPLGPSGPVSPGVATLVCVNSVMVVLLIMMIWSSLKN